jgi:uncharacterized protein (DUF2249 family)
MNELVIEAHTIPKTERHSHIFNSFDGLKEGQSLVIVIDHDPIPLLNEFGRIRAGQFLNEYLEQGPDFWSVKLTRKKGEGCCGFCGG